MSPTLIVDILTSSIQEDEKKLCYYRKVRLDHLTIFFNPCVNNKQSQSDSITMEEQATFRLEQMDILRLYGSHGTNFKIQSYRRSIPIKVDRRIGYYFCPGQFIDAYYDLCLVYCSNFFFY